MAWDIFGQPIFPNGENGEEGQDHPFTLFGLGFHIATEEEKQALWQRGIDEEKKRSKDRINLLFKKPPKNPIERIFYDAEVFIQMIMGILAMPVSMALFLVEESIQAQGMGAYILSTSRQYEALDTYIDTWAESVNLGQEVALSLGTFSPIMGGAVTNYTEATKHQIIAFKAANDANILKKAETDEALRKKLQDQQKYGTLRLQSSPSQAQIFTNGVDTQLLTPETFKQIDPGTYTFLLKKYSVARDVVESLEFTINIEAGRKKEIYARIPKTIAGKTEPSEDPAETDEPQLPLWIKANVTGEYAIDGDTFITTTGERIRVLAIDAPEIGRPWADVSKEALGLLVEDKSISLRIQSHKPLGPHGRTLAICSSYKGDIAVFQLSSGLARVAEFEDDLFDYGKYYSAEQVAKDRKIGIWS